MTDGLQYNKMVAAKTLQENAAKDVKPQNITKRTARWQNWQKKTTA